MSGTEYVPPSLSGSSLKLFRGRTLQASTSSSNCACYRIEMLDSKGRAHTRAHTHTRAIGIAQILAYEAPGGGG
eukprot:13768254-Alexandrium_andersonii.AAC.1